MSSKQGFLAFFERNRILKLFRESLLIIFSILFALFVNEWRANQNLEKDKEKAMASIALELENNLASLRSVMPYHKDAGESLEQFLALDNIQDSLVNRNAIELFFQHCGNKFREPRVQGNAWHAAQLSGALNRFDNETIYHLSTLYELQKEGVETGWKMMVESFFETECFDSSKTYPVLKKLQKAMSGLAGMERYLIGKHEKTLEHLKDN